MTVHHQSRGPCRVAHLLWRLEVGERLLPHVGALLRATLLFAKSRPPGPKDLGHPSDKLPVGHDRCA